MEGTATGMPFELFCAGTFDVDRKGKSEAKSGMRSDRTNRAVDLRSTVRSWNGSSRPRKTKARPKLVKSRYFGDVDGERA